MNGKEGKKKPPPTKVAKGIAILMYLGGFPLVFVGLLGGVAGLFAAHKVLWRFCLGFGRLVDRGHRWGWARNWIATVIIEAVILAAVLILPQVFHR